MSGVSDLDLFRRFMDMVDKRDRDRELKPADDAKPGRPRRSGSRAAVKRRRKRKLAHESRRRNFQR